MINYEQFKNLFALLESGTEIEFYLKDSFDVYMIVKQTDFIIWGKCSPQSTITKFSSLDELYNAKTIDGICLKKDWKNVRDIVLHASYSVIEEKEELEKMYKINLN